MPFGHRTPPKGDFCFEIFPSPSGLGKLGKVSMPFGHRTPPKGDFCFEIFPSPSGLGKPGLMGEVPIVEGGNAVFDFHRVAPAQRVEFGNIGEFAQRAIGF